jgi:hypothetical protein
MTRFPPGLAARSACHRNASCRFSGEDSRPRRDALLSWCVTRKQAPGAPVSSEPDRDARYRTAAGPKLGREDFARSSNRPAGTRNRHCATRLSKTNTRTRGRLTRLGATPGFTFHDARPTSARVSRIPLGVVFRNGIRDSLTSDVPTSVPCAPAASFEASGAHDAKAMSRYPDSA